MKKKIFIFIVILLCFIALYSIDFRDIKLGSNINLYTDYIDKTNVSDTLSLYFIKDGYYLELPFNIIVTTKSDNLITSKSITYSTSNFSIFTLYGSKCMSRIQEIFPKLISISIDGVDVGNVDKELIDLMIDEFPINTKQIQTLWIDNKNGCLFNIRCSGEYIWDYEYTLLLLILNI